MTETDNLNALGQPFAPEINTENSSKYENQSGQVATIIYVIGFFILAVPIISLIFLMLISSYRAFLFSSPLLRFLGILLIIVPSTLILFLGKLYLKRSANKSAKISPYFYASFILGLIILLFIFVGFILYSFFFSGLVHAAEIRTTNNIISSPQSNIQTNLENNSVENISIAPISPVENKEVYIPYDKPVLKDLNLYTMGANSKSYRFEDLINAMGRSPIFQDLPSSGSIKISFFSVENDEEIIDQTFLFAADSEIKPDIELFINSAYIDSIIRDLCSGIQEAQNNDGFRYKLNKNNVILFSKYSNLMQYKSCFLGA